MKKEIRTAECLYCRQLVSFEADGEVSEDEAAQLATLNCSCYMAGEHRQEIRRRKCALDNIDQMIGSEAKPDNRASEDIVSLMKAAVDGILGGELEKITLNINGGVKVAMSQNAKGDICLERTATKKEKTTSRS